jgi:hypothetical protein
MDLSSRSCGTCTKCCEGYISGGAHGIKFGNGVPCEFLALGHGCTIYEDRPLSPCKKFKCEWLKNNDMPEHFKPEVSHFMAMRKGQNFIVLVTVGPNPNYEVVDWYKRWCSENKFNLAYRQDNRDYFFGDPEFVAKMYNSLGPA